MIRIFTLLFILGAYSPGTASDRSSSVVYVDASTNQQIKVKFKRNHIKVKYLTRKKWVKYHLVGPAEFDNYRGSKIYLKGRNKLVWRSRKYGEQVTFRRYNHYRERSNFDRCQRNYSPNLEGIWYQAEMGKELILLDNRSGIKLRFRGERNWFYFEELNDGVYRDRNGNTYTMLSDSRIRWNDARGYRSYVLEKRSDRIDWD